MLYNKDDDLGSPILAGSGDCSIFVIQLAPLWVGKAKGAVHPTLNEQQGRSYMSAYIALAILFLSLSSVVRDIFQPYSVRVCKKQQRKSRRGTDPEQASVLFFLLTELTCQGALLLGRT